MFRSSVVDFSEVSLPRSWSGLAVNDDAAAAAARSPLRREGERTTRCNGTCNRASGSAMVGIAARKSASVRSDVSLPESPFRNASGIGN